MTSPVEPMYVLQDVEEFVRKRLDNAKKYDNVEPLDESGIYELHQLAAQIYANGYRDGEATAQVRLSSRDLRLRIAAQEV